MLNTIVFFKEHQLYLSGNWMNWETCIQDIDPDTGCPICEDGTYKYGYVGAYSIIDLSKYTTKKGVKVTASKKLFIVKATARRKIVKQKERRDGDLTFCEYETTRYTSKECSTGEDFEFIKRATLDEVKATLPEAMLASAEDAAKPLKERGGKMTPEEWVTPYDYAELFKPKSAEELRAVIGAPAPVGSAGDQVPDGDASGSLKSLV